MDLPLPDDDAPLVAWLLYNQDRVLSREQAIEGFGVPLVRKRLNAQAWQEPVRGVVVTHNGPLTNRQRVWVAVLHGGSGAVCAGLTAAALDGLRGYESPEVHLLVPAARRVGTTQGVRVHRSAMLPASQLLGQAPPRTVLARSIVDGAAWARTDDDARALVMAAFQQGKVAGSTIGEVLSTMPRSRRRGLVAETVAFAMRGAHAISELWLVDICRKHGLPVPDQQVRRVDADGRVRHLDAHWRRWRLHVEADGAGHAEIRTWWSDMRRQNNVWIAGERLLRFPGWALRHDQHEVARQLRAALVAAGWQP
jgi:very-short-patch-repair endonuclease